MIADHATDEGDNAWPSQQTIATRASCNIRTVQRSINELVAKGYLWVEKRGGGSASCRDDRRPHRYTIVLKRLRGDKTPPRKEQRGDNHDMNEATSTTATGRQSRPMKHPIETPIETPNTFDLFWNNYPRKTAKGAARKAWEKIKPEEQEQVAKAAALFAADPNRDETYTPHPATWLNAERWLDEPLPPRKQSQEEIRAYELTRAREKAERERLESQKWLQEAERRKAEAIPMPENIKEILRRL